MMAPLSPFLCLCLFLSVRAELNDFPRQPPPTTLSVNASSQLFTNISSTSLSGFPYIIPYGQTQDCDVYGSPCQTGLITVGVNLTTATTSTVLPCSSYLSAQFTYIWNQTYFGVPTQDNPATGNKGEGWGNGEGDPWGTNFGQSPQCRSYAEAMGRGQSTFSDCVDSNTSIQTDGGLPAMDLLQNYPGLVRYFDPDDEDVTGTCCGNCSLSIPEVRLYYFPEKSAIQCYNNQTFNSTSNLSARKLEKRVHSLIISGSTTVVSGHTFTSPSVYLQLMGKATVSDQCATVGPILTSPIITLPPGALSTWKPEAGVYYDYNGIPFDNFTIGEVWSDPSGDTEGPGILPQDIKTLNVQDLACPTWGLGLSTSANGNIITTIGPPWLPLIVPPMEMFSLNPTWASECTGFWTDPFILSTFALFDPPIALTPAALLLPTPPARLTPAPAPAPAEPTTVSERIMPSAETAKPASLPNDPAAAPAKTGDSGRDSPTPSPVGASADPAGSVPVFGSPAASPKNTGDPPPDPPSDPKVPLVAGDSPADSHPASSSAPDPPPGESQSPSADPQVPIVPVPPQGLGAIIYNALGKSGPDIGGASTKLLSPQSIFTIGAQTFAANPTGFTVNNAAIVPGGIAQSIDGTTISLDKSGVLAIGSSTILLQHSSDTSPSKVYTIAGQTFIPNPSGFSIAGTMISAGGPAISVDGTTISLDRSGALAIGSTTISLTTPASTPSATEAFTVADQTFTPNPSAFSIAGTTISANGPAITISGTIVSLGQSGALEIGSSTVYLPTPSDTSPLDASPYKAYTAAGQVFTPNPSAFSIAGTTVSAGGPAVTVDGTIISLGQGGALAIGSSTVDLPTLSYTPSKAYTVAGQTFTPNPTAFSIAGTTVSAGGPAVTVGGTIVSLQPSGTLIVGSSTIPLLTSPTRFPSDVNIDGFDVKAQPSFAVVDGVTVSAGAAGVTVSGEMISLQPGGATLDIGTGRFALPTARVTTNGSLSVQAFMGGQSKGMESSLVFVCSFCGVFMLLI